MTSLENTPTKSISSVSSIPSSISSIVLPDTSSLRSVSTIRSSSSSTAQQSLRSRRFDERLTSRFSKLPTRPPPIEALDLVDRSANDVEVGISGLKWIPVGKLNDVLKEGINNSQYGTATAIVAGDVIAVGTSIGTVLVFDYKQTLLHILGTGSPGPNLPFVSSGTAPNPSSPVSSMAFSLDSSRLACGYASGEILVFDLRATSKAPLRIEPLSEKNRLGDGHVAGSTVNSLCFVGKHNSILVSGDTDGLAFYHHLQHGVLGPKVMTEKLLGRYEDIGVSLSTIFGCAALPLGTFVQRGIDSQGLVAIMTRNALLVISTAKSIRTRFKTGKPKVVNDSIGLSGCLSWFPAIVLKDGTQSPAKLAYCWANVLTVIEITARGDSFTFDSKKRLLCDEHILAVQWINSSVIGLLTSTQQLVLINERTMKESTKVDLISNHIYNHDLYSRSYNHAGLVSGFPQSFKTYKGKLFFVGKYEILIGSLPAWTDVLYRMVDQQRYTDAIEKARQYYLGTTDIDVVGLPLKDKERHKLVLSYLVNIIKASATHILDGYDDQSTFKETIDNFMYTAIKALVSINAESVVYEDMYDIFQLQNHKDLYFQSLEPFILTGFIKTLTPVILKNMVEYYISAAKNDTLEQLICLLDIKSLDIDFTIALLKKHNLRDSYIYIWNNLIHDYITPLMDFFDDIEKAKGDAPKIFAYLVYILTGRAYPTENFLEQHEAENAKLSIYYVLFNGTVVSWPSADGSANDSHLMDENYEENTFPYLKLLLKYDSKAFLSAINECFEDSLMNDDEVVYGNMRLKVNRQFVMEILINIFKENKTEFEDKDRLNLSIFIARIYPKFQQFIRLPEPILAKTINVLCEYNGEDEKEDCELSLQSLLSVYQPPNKSELVQRFEKAEFHEILMNMYLNDRKFAKVLELWLKYDRSNSIETNDAILEKCFKSTLNDPKERREIQHVVKKNFVDLIEVDTFKIAKVLNKYSPQSHGLLFELTEDHLKYLYLSSLVELEKAGQYHLNTKERNEYIKMLSKYEQKSLFRYVQTLNRDDFSFGDCVGALREYGAVDTLVYLFKVQNNYKEALEEVIKYIKISIDEIAKCHYNKNNISVIEASIWKYLLIGIELCNHEDSKESSFSTTVLSSSETMWLKFIESMVQLFKDLDKKETSSKVMDVVKRLVQDLFSTLINTRFQINNFHITKDGVNEHHSSFLKIFMQFLSSSSMNITLLGDIRSVSTEIYLAFSYEKNVLTITSKLINEGIYISMQKLQDRNLIGWSVSSYECDACGKIIWGRGIDSQAYCRWESKQRDEEIADNDIFSLVSFNCHHCYHKNCLKNLGVKDDNFVCIICDDQKDLSPENNIA